MTDTKMHTFEFSIYLKCEGNLTNMHQISFFRATLAQINGFPAVRRSQDLTKFIRLIS
jgi:hypothetical protein